MSASWPFSDLKPRISSHALDLDLELQSSELGVQSSGFKAWGSGVRARSAGLKAQGAKFRAHSGFGTRSSGFKTAERPAGALFEKRENHTYVGNKECRLRLQAGKKDEDGDRRHFDFGGQGGNHVYPRLQRDRKDDAFPVCSRRDPSAERLGACRRPGAFGDDDPGAGEKDRVRPAVPHTSVSVFRNAGGGDGPHGSYADVLHSVSGGLRGGGAGPGAHGNRTSEGGTLYGDQRRRASAGPDRQGDRTGVRLPHHGRAYVEPRFRQPRPRSAAGAPTGGDRQGNYHDDPRSGSRFFGGDEGDRHQGWTELCDRPHGGDPDLQSDGRGLRNPHGGGGDDGAGRAQGEDCGGISLNIRRRLGLSGGEAEGRRRASR